jgi:hypothetical protein
MFSLEEVSVSEIWSKIILETKSYPGMQLFEKSNPSREMSYRGICFGKI